MSNNTCGQTVDYSNNIHKFEFVVYHVSTPIFAVFALFGQVLLLFALIQRFKSEQMYMYQVYCGSAEAVAVVIKILYFLSIQTDLSVMGDYRTSFQESLSRCYTCVWYSARLAAPLAASICTLCLLLSTVMAADRVVALIKPMAHKNANHKVLQRGSLAICILLSFSSSAFDIGKNYAAPASDGRYTKATDVAYANQMFIRVLALIRVFGQAFALIALASLSAVLCYLYRTRVSSLKAKIGGRTAQEAAKRKENTLILFSLFQCLHSVLYMTMGLCLTALSYSFPVWYTCWRGALGTSVDLARIILDVTSFYGVLLVSKKVRRAVKNAFPCTKNETTQSTSNVVELRTSNKQMNEHEQEAPIKVG